MTSKAIGRQVYYGASGCITNDVSLLWVGALLLLGMLVGRVSWAAPTSVESHATSSAHADHVSLPARLVRDEGYFLFRLPLQKGDYVQGQLQSEGSTHAWLSTPDRSFWRHLNQVAGEDARFQWVAPRSGTYYLEVESDSGWQVRLSSLARLPFEPPKPAQKHPESPLIQQAIERLQAGQSEDKVWASLVAEGTPLVEPLPRYASRLPDYRLVTFLWRGAQHNVHFLGAFGRVNRQLYRLPYTDDIWFRSYHMEDSTRMSYQMAPDVPYVKGSAQAQKDAAQAVAQRDPYNRKPWGPHWDRPFDYETDPFMMKSILELERVSKVTYLEPPDHPLPFMQRYKFRDPAGHLRQVDIWQPEDLVVKADMSVPVVIFLNGLRYQNEIPAPRILQNLMDERLIPPTMAVLVSYPNPEVRQEALSCDPEFSEFIAQHVIPLIQRETGYRLRRHQIMLAGAGYGGLAAVCTAYRYPRYFGMVLSQSGAFWWHPEHPALSEALKTRFEQAEETARPIRFYLSSGWFESDFGTGPGVRSSTQHLAQTLMNKGHQVVTERFNAGHDVYHWRTTLWRGLVMLLKPLSSDVKMPLDSRGQ